MWRAPEGLVSRFAGRVVGPGGVGLAAAWPVTTKTGRRDLERLSHHAAEMADTHRFAIRSDRDIPFVCVPVRFWAQHIRPFLNEA